jgi:tRNA threonylcarbamoyladenosine biosynthesis protein TsaE
VRIDLSSPHARRTKALGVRLGRLLQAGDVVCLYGELGSGKTTLTQGLARGLGVPHGVSVRSPSFVLIHRYGGRVPVYHVDLFRLDTPGDCDDIGLRELLDGEAVIIVEWAERLGTLRPASRLDVTLRYGHEGEMRQITLQPQGERYRRLMEQWRGQAGEGWARSQEPDSKVHGAVG